MTHPWKGLGVPGTRVFGRQDEQGMATTGKVQLLLLPSLTEARSSGGAGEAAALGRQGDGVARRVALREARGDEEEAAGEGGGGTGTGGKSTPRGVRQRRRLASGSARKAGMMRVQERSGRRRTTDAGAGEGHDRRRRRAAGVGHPGGVAEAGRGADGTGRDARCAMGGALGRRGLAPLSFSVEGGTSEGEGEIERREARGSRGAAARGSGAGSSSPCSMRV